MRDIIIFSNRKIEKDDCYSTLINEIPYIKSNGNDLMIDAKNRLYLNFSSDRINSPMDESSDEFQKHIPIDNAYLTFIETYRSIDAKRVVSVLLSIYEELYVYIDELDWYGSSQEFINAEFDFWL